MVREVGKELSWSIFPIISHRAQHTTGAQHSLDGDDGVYQSGLLLSPQLTAEEGREEKGRGCYEAEMRKDFKEDNTMWGLEFFRSG